MRSDETGGEKARIPQPRSAPHREQIIRMDIELDMGCFGDSGEPLILPSSQRYASTFGPSAAPAEQPQVLPRTEQSAVPTSERASAAMPSTGGAVRRRACQAVCACCVIGVVYLAIEVAHALFS